MNHELGSTVGSVRAHGSKGAFVSRWVIDKRNLRVVSGSDLIREVFLWDAGTQRSFAASDAVAPSRWASS